MPFDLPSDTNSTEALTALRSANVYYRTVQWPEPYNQTAHNIHVGDSRNLPWIPDGSVDLVVTSPPYWNIKKYAGMDAGQLGDIADYSGFLDSLDSVWRECARVLTMGGRICCVVGDVCVSRKSAGRHYVRPLHADIQVRAQRLGLDCLTPILWHKVANGSTEASGNGCGFYGKPYEPGGIVKNDIEYILFFRKGGEYRSVDPLRRALSMLTKDEMQAWFRSIWTDIPGQSCSNGHPAPYPQDLADRLISMFSFAGDTILDPFMGSGTTIQAAIATGRNSIGVDISAEYAVLAAANARQAANASRVTGPTHANVYISGKPLALQGILFAA